MYIRKGVLFHSVCPVLPCNFCAPQFLICSVYLPDCSADAQRETFLPTKAWQPHACIFRLQCEAGDASSMCAAYSPPEGLHQRQQQQKVLDPGMARAGMMHTVLNMMCLNQAGYQQGWGLNSAGVITVHHHLSFH